MVEGRASLLSEPNKRYRGNKSLYFYFSSILGRSTVRGGSCVGGGNIHHAIEAPYNHDQ